MNRLDEYGHSWNGNGHLSNGHAKPNYRDTELAHYRADLEASIAHAEQIFEALQNSMKIIDRLEQQNSQLESQLRTLRESKVEITPVMSAGAILSVPFREEE